MDFIIVFGTSFVVTIPNNIFYSWNLTSSLKSFTHPYILQLPSQISFSVNDDSLGIIKCGIVSSN